MRSEKMTPPVKQPRPKDLPGKSIRVTTGCGKMYVTVNTLDDKPFEIFATLGKSGGCTKANTEAITRCIATGLRHGVPVEEYIKQLENIQCLSSSYSDGDEIKSCPDAIARVLKGYLPKPPEAKESRLEEIHRA